MGTHLWRLMPGPFLLPVTSVVVWELVQDSHKRLCHWSIKIMWYRNSGYTVFADVCKSLCNCVPMPSCAKNASPPASSSPPAAKCQHGTGSPRLPKCRTYHSSRIVWRNYLSSQWIPAKLIGRQVDKYGRIICVYRYVPSFQCSNAKIDKYDLE